MAKLTLSVSLVNGSAFPEREIASDDLMEKFVGDDTGVPVRNVWLTVYTDDGKQVHIAVPVNGREPLSATVSDWDGEPPNAEPPGRRMAILPFDDITGVLGEASSHDDMLGGTFLWDCGCHARPRLGYSASDPDAEFEWTQCDQHTGLGTGPHRAAPEHF